MHPSDTTIRTQYQTIDAGLDTVTGGYDWKEAGIVTGATTAFGTWMGAGAGLAQARSAGWGRLLDVQGIKRGAAFGAKRGALIGFGMDSISQAVHHFTK